MASHKPEIIVKLAAVFLFASCCAFAQDKIAASRAETAACGSRDVKLEVKVDRLQHPNPAPPDGKALVYVVSQEMHDEIGLDGKWAGANDRGTYFFVEVGPGEHHLCAFASFGAVTFLALHSLEAKADTSYYFRPIPIGDGGRGGTYSLEQLDPDEGKYLVAKAKFATSQHR
jgi:hypothetical protein